MNNIYSPRFPVKVTQSFLEYISQKQINIVATLVPNRLIFISSDRNGRLIIDDAILDSPWGLAINEEFLAVATRRDISIYASNKKMAAYHPAAPGQFDAYYTPRVTHAVGDCQIHDLWLSSGQLYAVNTRFSVICKIDLTYNFTPVWQPAFVTDLMPEDRCHLNGMAWDNNQLAYATAFGSFNSEREWRKHDPYHGVVIDTQSNTILTSGLCLPHSPRVVNSDLYATEMGAGRLIRINRENGQVEEICRFDGMPRGFACIDGIAFVGLSLRRESLVGWKFPDFDHKNKLMVGIVAVDLSSGSIIGFLEFLSGFDEVFDVQLLPESRRSGIMDISRWDGFFPIDSPQNGFWTKYGAENTAHK